MFPPAICGQHNGQILKHEKTFEAIFQVQVFKKDTRSLTLAGSLLGFV